MDKNHYNVIGVMSGTSLDGVDVALISFDFNDRWKFEILVAETIAYPAEWEERLKNLTSNPPETLQLLDKEYTAYLGQIISQFIKKHQISNLDAVCSHGHTALHQPQNRLTYQIGNLPILATLVGQKVICDFRVEDVTLGGQGAPLVPIGDKLLFSQYDFCLNLGGFANISTEIDGQRIAYDICPVNIVLNHYVKRLGLDFDEGGHLASNGKIHHGLLKELNALEFYQQAPPKSLGLEWVKIHLFPLIDSFQMEINDILRTFVEHIAFQISKEANLKSKASVLMTGGGVYNDFLIERLKSYTYNVLIVPDKYLIEFKEALIFGFLGVLKMRNEVNCLSRVTGAARDHSSGKIYCP